MAYMRAPDYIYATGDDHAESLVINGEPISFAAAQELAVMLVAEMTDEEREATEQRAVAKHTGNVGCEALTVRRGGPTIGEQIDALTHVLLQARDRD